MSDAQAGQVLHGDLGLVRERSEGVGGASEIVEGCAASLEREPAKPAYGGSLIALGLLVADHQADTKRVWQADRRQPRGMGSDEFQIPLVERSKHPRSGHRRRWNWLMSAIRHRRTYVRTAIKRWNGRRTGSDTTQVARLRVKCALIALSPPVPCTSPSLLTTVREPDGSR